ncbi:hypothetical protein GCM10010172_11800 [Paractinoplanes ferrugineus]|uniref:DUF4166 domain-containing protein n=1 Tax=Paractinoplanes ferrugineus TaxID=113564 RepID=A0A919IZR5_9ACTN|nr:hypothetical protein Afe05nite_15840 [Actinoplanes ferrugineus]
MKARFRVSVIGYPFPSARLPGEIVRDHGQGAGEKFFVDGDLASPGRSRFAGRFFRSWLMSRHRWLFAPSVGGDVLGRLELRFSGFRLLARSYAAISPLVGADGSPPSGSVRAIVRPSSVRALIGADARERTDVRADDQG